MPDDESSSIRRIVDLIDAINCGAMLVHRSGHIVHANRRLCEMMRRRDAELDGADIRDFYRAEDGITFVRERLERFDESHEGEVFIDRQDGSRLPVMVSGRILRDRMGLPDHKLVTVIDLSDRAAAEDRLREQYQSVAQLSDTVLDQAIQLKHSNETLETRVRARTAELHEANMDAIYMLAVASEAKDLDTGLHVRRIQHYTRALCEHLALPESTVDQYGYSAILHDVGKMAVPDEILKKPGPLSPAERSVMETHTIEGERILSAKPFFETARLIARSHHENWAGDGYPDGLAAEDIPFPARIVHLVDVFDALSSARVYKAPWPPDRVVQTIQQDSTRAFDPELVRAFMSLVKLGTIDRIRTKLDARK